MVSAGGRAAGAGRGAAVWGRGASCLCTYPAAPFSTPVHGVLPGDEGVPVPRSRLALPPSSL